MNTEGTTAYWLFQSSPEVFRLADALRQGALATFALKAHRERVKAGDRVILWQTGREAGCYGLATVTGDPEEISVPASEEPFFLHPPAPGLRVPLRVDFNCWNQPITPDMLQGLSSFERFNAGLPGTNYQATRGQYRALEDLVRRLDLALEPELEYQTPDRTSSLLNLILYGPPGTGKTYQTINYALSIIENRPLEELLLEDRQELRRRFNEYLGRGQVAFVTFHQSFTYEDFVEGIKPGTQGQQITYEMEDGIFKLICQDARRDTGRHYVLIIDEINRGNVPAIFGDLISLIEPDKREGREEALSIRLPYSKTLFSVPPNLYLIGTMNTTDRSVESLDVALRRRFTFRENRPQPDLIRRLARRPVTAGIDLARMLDTINARLERLLDREHCIGHAYFFHVQSLADLRRVFAEVILPQLREYFFHDYGRIGLVLGRDFVRETGSSAATPFADFDYPFAEELAEQPLYELRPPEELDEGAFIRIYDPAYQ